MNIQIQRNWSFLFQIKDTYNNVFHELNLKNI